MLVVGGGVAGVRAASAAAELGADVVLVDEQWPPHVQGVEVLARASALGYFDGLVPVWQEDTLHQVRARRHVFATGTIEQPLMFEGNDLPGVMLSGGVRRLIEHYAVRPGARAVVVAAREIVATLERTGIEVHLVPPEHTELLRPQPGGHRQHHVGVQPGIRGDPQQVLRLL